MEPRRNRFVAGLALALALGAAEAGARPLAVEPAGLFATLEQGWGWLWTWLLPSAEFAGHEKEGICIDPDGRTCPGPAAIQPPGGGRVRPGPAKVGIGIDPDGKTCAVPAAAGAASFPGTNAWNKVGIGIDPNGVTATSPLGGYAGTGAGEGAGAPPR